MSRRCEARQRGFNALSERYQIGGVNKRSPLLGSSKEFTEILKTPNWLNELNELKDLSSGMPEDTAASQREILAFHSSDGRTASAPIAIEAMLKNASDPTYAKQERQRPKISLLINVDMHYKAIETKFMVNNRGY